MKDVIKVGARIMIAGVMCYVIVFGALLAIYKAHPPKVTVNVRAIGKMTRSIKDDFNKGFHEADSIKTVSKLTTDKELTQKILDLNRDIKSQDVVINDLNADISRTYKSVQDFTKADAIATDRAIKALGLLRNELNRANTAYKRLEASLKNTQAQIDQNKKKASVFKSSNTSVLELD